MILISDASISLFQFRYDIDRLRYLQHIAVKYVSKMHVFADLNFNGQVFLCFANVHFNRLMKGKGPYVKLLL